MKLLLVLLSALLLARVAPAQEHVPLEEAKQMAQLLAKSGGAIANPQIKVEPNLDQPRAIKGDGLGLLVTPDAKTTAAALAKADKDVVPIGQLWLYAIVPAPGGKAVSNSKLRFVNVTIKDKSAEVQFYLLGARKGDNGKLELVVYAKDKEPLLRLPLEATDGAQDSPIELQGRKSGDDSGVLTLNLFGKYKTELTLMKPE